METYKGSSRFKVRDLERDFVCGSAFFGIRLQTSIFRDTCNGDPDRSVDVDKSGGWVCLLVEVLVREPLCQREDPRPDDKVQN